ncbi:MAG TPA: hypothetical protein VMA53_05225 [Stellaceae bacterium]|nr:hypothetical protein [Stellaceae bacterium]
MRVDITTRPSMTVMLVSAVLLLASAAALADPPGYDFMMFPDRMALVVGDTNQAPKGVISEKDAAALTAGAQPLSGRSIVLMYHGKYYIVPDKRMANGEMASHAVMSAAKSAGK